MTGGEISVPVRIAGAIATPQQPLPQFLAGRRQPGQHRAPRTAEPLGRLGGAATFQVAQHHRPAEPFRQAVELFVEQFGQLVPLGNDKRIVRRASGVSPT